MRYYDITISGPSAIAGASSPLTLNWTSFPSGILDGGALQVEFDFFTFQSVDTTGYSTITIYGISLSDLQQAPAYTGRTITVKAGMQAGLPLANPGQQGTILHGTIFQSFGNWVGTDMTLDLIITSSPYSYSNPGNFVLNWPAGTSLKAALASCLNVAFPNQLVTMNIGDEYVLGHSEWHSCNTLNALSQYVNSISKSIIAQTPGVKIALQPDNSILVSDGSIAVGKPIQLLFTDLIGQPTWIDQGIMQFTTVLRADIQVFATVLMPIGLPSGPGTVTLTGQASPSQLKYKTAFQGPFNIQAVRHIGNFRDPQGSSWATVFRANPPTIGTTL